MKKPLNRRTRRRLGLEAREFSQWVDAAPDAPIRRREFRAVTNAAMNAAMREYHDSRRLYRRVPRWIARWLVRPVVVGWNAIFDRWRRWRGRRT